jgi:D-methionine transport system substrate-binding protein
VGENNEQWEVIKKTLAKENITLELVKFAEYVLPNQALAEGEIDLNAFQHYAYLNNEIKTKQYKITPIGNTLIAPLGLYSQKVGSVSEIKAGDKIAIPNDVVNGGRALKVLEAAGLLKVNPDTGYAPTVGDITENPLKLEIIEVEAAQTPKLLPDVAAAIINGGHAVDAGLNPTKDSIALEEVVGGSDNPFINVIAARTEDKDNPVYKKVVDAYHTDEVKNVIETTYAGAYLVAW